MTIPNEGSLKNLPAKGWFWHLMLIRPGKQRNFVLREIEKGRYKKISREMIPNAERGYLEAVARRQGISTHPSVVAACVDNVNDNAYFLIGWFTGRTIYAETD